MPISFNEIPQTIRTPLMYAEFDSSKAVSGPSEMPYKKLVLGQRTTAGTIAALTPIRVTSAAQAKTYFGAGSLLAQQLESHFANNSFTETWVVALDDEVAGVAATGSILVGGVVAAGTVSLMLGGRRVRVGVAVTDTLADIASNIVDAITADTDLIVSAAVNGSTAEQVDLTFKHKGETGNDLDIRHSYYDGESLPSGLTLTITAMSGGTANPDIDAVWPVIGDEHYHIIDCPYRDAANLTALETELSDRKHGLRMIEAVAFTAAIGTHGALGTLGDSRNHAWVSIMGASGSPTPTWVWSAAVSAQVAYHANIDQARPFQTLPLVDVLPPKPEDRFTKNERNLLLYDGISTFTVDAGGVVRIERLITTYKTNPQGAEDPAYLDVNSPLTLGYIRYDWNAYIARHYPRHKLADDGTRFGQGQKVITPKIGRAEALARFRVWEAKGLVEGFEQFKQDLIVERNQADVNRMDWMLPPNLMNQFRVGGVQIGFLL